MWIKLHLSEDGQEIIINMDTIEKIWDCERYKTYISLVSGEVLTVKEDMYEIMSELKVVTIRSEWLREKQAKEAEELPFL